MAYKQQRVMEQEAIEIEPKLKLVQKYTQEAKTYLSYKHRIKNRRHILKKLPRSGVVIKAQKTAKTCILHPRAISIAETVLNKMAYDGEEEVILTHKYLHKITDCLADQNKRHIKQLNNLFYARYKRAYLKNSRFYEYCYVFKLNPAITEELRKEGLLEAEFIPAKKLASINNKNISNEIKIRSIRSNSNSQIKVDQFVTESFNSTKKADEDDSNGTKNFRQSETPGEITSIKNKPTHQISKHGNNNMLHNGFLAGKKALNEIQPYLTDEICKKLRSNSARAFTNTAIREITKAIATSKKGSKAFFYHINGVVSYLTLALIQEKRDPNKTNSENYYTLASMSEADKLWHQREKYLASIEEGAIKHANPQNHFKAKLANTLDHSKAYELLMALINIKMEGTSLKITLNRQVNLTEFQLDIVLFQARAVFNNCNLYEEGQYVEVVEYVVSNTCRTLETN